MSASPDFMNTLLAQMQGGQNNPMYSPLLGLAAGLLQAGGPSRMPTSLGQALGAGLQSGQQFQQAGLQNQMQQLQLGRTAAQMQMLRAALSGDNQNTQQSSPDQQQGQQQQPYTSGIVANPIQGPSVGPMRLPLMQTPQLPPQTTQNLPAMTQGGTPVPAQPQTPMQPQVQPLPRFDPYRDPEYVRDMKLAQVMDMMQPGTGAAWASAGQQRLQDLNNQVLTVNGDQAKQFIPNGLIPGQSIAYHPATGDWAVKGDPSWKDITYTDPVDGQTKHILWNQTTNQYKGIPGVSGSMPTTSPTGGETTPSHIPPQIIKQYPGIGDTPGIGSIPPAYLPQVVKIASGEQDYPSSANRNPTFGKNLTGWITTINPDWKQQNFNVYGKQMMSLSNGDDAKKLDPLNTIEGHLDTYGQAMSALQNGNTQLANKLANSVNLQLGKGPQAAVLAVKQLVSGELAKAVSGGTVGEGDRDQANAILANYNSPEQTADILKKIQQLIGGKLAAIRQRYAANGLGGYFDMRLNKSAYQAMNDSGNAQQQAAPISASSGDPLGIRQ